MSDTTTQHVDDFEGDDDIVDLGAPDDFEGDDDIVDLDAPDEFGPVALQQGTGEYITVSQFNPATQEVEKHQVDLSLPPLNPDEARDITEKIKHSANQMYLLVKRAHAGRAWEALGYSGFAEYVQKEFQTSTSWAYRLLSQANIIEAIEAKVPAGTVIELGEPVARSLKKVLPEVLADVEERTAGLDARSAGDVLDEVVTEHLARIDREETEAAEAQYEGQFGDENDYDGERQYDTPYNPDYEYGGDDDEDEGAAPVEPQRDPAQLMALRKNLEGLFNLYSGLKSLADVGDADTLIPHIRVDRRNEFTALLEIVVPWVADFQTKWLEYLRQVEEEERLALEDSGELDAIEALDDEPDEDNEN